MYHIEIYDTIFQSNESLHFKILKARLLQSRTHTQKLDYVTSICNKIKICVFFYPLCQSHPEFY